MSIGTELLVSVLAKGDILFYHKLGLTENLFYGEEVELFKVVDKHVKKYSTLPKLSTISEQFTDLPEPVEAPLYYADQVLERFTHKRLNLALTDCNEHMKEMDAWTAMNIVQGAIADILRTNTRGGLMEFTQAGYDAYMAAYFKNKTQADQIGVMMGWKPLDNMTKGLRGGDVVSIVGRPAMGKSFCLLYSALHVSVKQSMDTMVVSMEMGLPELTERLVAMYTTTPMDHIHGYELSSNQQVTVPKKLSKVKNVKGKLYLLDGNLSSTVDDIFALVAQLNPKVLYIDGAYLLKHPDTRMNKYQRIDHNIELIKRKAGDFGIPVVLSYQFNREGAKKQKKNKDDLPGLENIAGSDAIGQISSIVLGMFQEEGVETMISRQIHILKGRNGQIGKFDISWDFFGMDFGYLDEEAKKKKGEFGFF